MISGKVVQVGNRSSSVIRAARDNSTLTMDFAKNTHGRAVVLGPAQRSLTFEGVAAGTGLMPIGRMISHYQLLGPLGRGGMGVIYRAQDVRLGRPVAIKFASEAYHTETQFDECIQREAQMAAAVNHANVCAVYDVGDFDGRPFMVMELLLGKSLRQMLGLPVGLEQFFDLAIQISSGLAAVHSRGIVHQDIKPSNIFVTSAGHAKILDFGLALKEEERLCQGSSGRRRKLRGTPAYMSPEQILGERLDCRTDLFSLGAVLYEMLTTGRRFRGVTISDVLDNVVEGRVAQVCEFRPELPARIGRLIQSTLEKDRELRCHSAANLRAGLRQLQSEFGFSLNLRGAQPLV